MSRRFFAFPLLACSSMLIVTASHSRAEPSPKDSPFLPPAAAARTDANTNAPYALTGMSVVGNETLIGVTRTSDKRSFWIPVGKTISEITAVSYDAKKEQAVIRANGQLQTIALKKSVVLPGLPAIAPAPPPMPVASPNTVAASPALPPVEVPTAPLSAQEEKEMEARMLVTDLLEIGQRQRKAYEEAQRQQAAARAAGKAPASDAQAPKQ